MVEKNKEKKFYKKPLLTAIKLQPEQAIIAACKVGAAWWSDARGCVYGATGGVGMRCDHTVRGSAPTESHHTSHFHQIKPS